MGLFCCAGDTKEAQIELEKRENELDKKEQQLEQREKKVLAEERAKSVGQVNPTFTGDSPGSAKKQQNKELDELRTLSTKQSNELVQKNREIETLKTQVRRAQTDLEKAQKNYADKQC
jgi:chromosome segregation ATPase